MSEVKEKGVFELNLDSDVFKGLKVDFDKMLRRTLSNMESKHSDSAELTLKLEIKVSSDAIPDFAAGDGTMRDIVRPSFVHKITSTMKIQDKAQGHVGGEYELVWDDEKCQFVMKKIDNGQVSMDDMENEADYVQGEDAEASGQPALPPSKPQLGDGSEPIEADYSEVDDEVEEEPYDEPEE